MKSNRIFQICFHGILIGAFLLPVNSTFAETSAPPQCNGIFWQKSEEIGNRLEENLNAAKKLEASNCQKAVVALAAMAKKEANDTRQNICSAEAKQLKEMQAPSDGPATQSSSFEATKKIAENNAKASEALIAALQERKKKIRKIRIQGQGVGSDFACWNNSINGQLSAQISSTDKILAEMEAHLESMEKAKVEQLQAAQKNAQTAAEDKEGLKSLGAGATAQTVKPYTPLPPFKETKEKSFLEKNAPLVAVVGVPLAGLLLGKALGASGGDSGSSGGGGSDDFFEDLGLAGSGKNSGGFGGSMSGFNNDCGSYSGGSGRAILQKYGIVVNRSMTESEAERVAAAAEAIPPCHRRWLKGAKIHSNPNLRFKRGKYAGKCLPGQQLKGFPELNFTCPGFRNGVIVHELYHHIDMMSGGRLQQQYPATKRCPVSQYVADYYLGGGNFREEDMCDAYRIAICGKGSASTRSDSCVDGQVAAVQKVIAACQ